MKSDDYLQGFRDGISVNTEHPQTLRIMGYGLDEIFKLVAKDQESKMPIVVHFQTETLSHGTVRLQTTQDGLELWVGGKLKYQWCKDNDK